MTERFSAEHRTFFITIYGIVQNGCLKYFKLDRKMKLFCGDNYSTTFKIVLLVRSGVPPNNFKLFVRSRIQALGFLRVFKCSVLFCAVPQTELCLTSSVQFGQSGKTPVQSVIK